MNSVVIDGVKFVAVSASTIRIVIMGRGWIVVGRVAEESEASLVIVDASVIRRWGTSRGLGEIAIGGPNDDTVLDPAGTIRVHPLAVVGQLDCVESKWGDKL